MGHGTFTKMAAKTTILKILKFYKFQFRQPGVRWEMLLIINISYSKGFRQIACPICSSFFSMGHGTFHKNSGFLWKLPDEKNHLIKRIKIQTMLPLMTLITDKYPPIVSGASPLLVITADQ